VNEQQKPILPGNGASDYERYLRTDDLLALQKPAEEMLHPDELTFQVVHQSSELLMKAAAWELERARERLAEGDTGNAARLMRRANRESRLSPSRCSTSWRASRPTTTTSSAPV
jgi:tryptophan 2,3-dioxygenase